MAPGKTGARPTGGGDSAPRPAEDGPSERMAAGDVALALGVDWRRYVALFFMAGVFESMGFGHLGAFTPLYLGQLHVTGHAVALWTGILGAIGWVIGIPMIPLWGVWAETVGRKFVIVRSAYVEAVLFGLAAAAPNVWVLAVARLLSGFVVGNTGVMFAIQSDVTPRRSLGQAVALVSAASPVGMAVGPLLGAVIIDATGIRSLLWLDSALSLLSGVALTLFLQDVRVRPAAQGDTASLIRRSVDSMLRTQGVLPLFALSFAANLGLQVVTPFVPILLSDLHRGPGLASLIGVVLTASGVALAVSTPLWGRIGDRIGYVAGLRAAAMGTAVFLTLQALAPSLLPFAASRVVMSLFQGGIGALTTTLLALMVPPERRASVLNFSLLPMQFTWFLGPIVGALAAQAGIRTAFWVGAGAALVAAVLALAIRLGQVAGGHRAPEAEAVGASVP